jgi:hypothetical protein
MLTWAIAFAFLFTGAILLSLRGLIPDPLSIVLANLLLLETPIFILAGIRRFKGRITSWRMVAVAGVVIAAWMGFF